jgi:hypothetical protein
MKKTAYKSSATLAMAALAGMAMADFTVFADNFDTDTSANWTVLKGTALGAGPADSNAIFSVDYSNLEGQSIVSAPNSTGGSTRGLYLTVNRNPGETASIEAISALPNISQLTVDHTLEFDMYMTWLGTVGTSVLGLGGLMHNGTTPFQQNTSGTGYTFGVSGDGGLAQDYRTHIGAAVQTGAAGGYQAPSFATNNTNAFYTAMFPSPPYAVAGAPGKQWVRVKITKVGNQYSWYINNNLLAQITNATYTSGLPMVGMQDPTTSVTQNGNFVLIDNVQVTAVPEPGTMAALGIGALALLRRRRNK